jgi:hypothetical protein
MVGNATALERLHVTGKHRKRSMEHTCSRHAAWDPHMARESKFLTREEISRSLVSVMQLQECAAAR